MDGPKQRKQSGRTGNSDMAYLGVLPESPTNFVTFERDPLTSDFKNWYIGDEWENRLTLDVFKLVKIQRGAPGVDTIATWHKMSGTTVLGGNNINVTTTLGVATVNLNKSIAQPNTNAAGTEGLYSLGGADFISNYGSGNDFFGVGAGNRTLTVATAKYNTGVGHTVFSRLTTGKNNTALGYQALADLTIGSDNTSVGWESMHNSIDAIGNCAFGQHALEACDGDYNVSVGWNSAMFMLTGSRNCLLGTGAGGNYVGAESNNINVNAVGVAAESNTLRIGLGTGAGHYELSKSFIHGIRGVTTDVVDAIPVLIDSNGQLGTISSSLRYKENVDDMGSTSERLYDLRPVTFNYKDRYPEFKSFGLIAEEVEESMPELVILDREGLPETVKYLDLIPMLLNEIQKLEKRVKELESR
jgi:hypothetical protein